MTIVARFDSADAANNGASLKTKKPTRSDASDGTCSDMRDDIVQLIQERRLETEGSNKKRKAATNASASMAAVTGLTGDGSGGGGCGGSAEEGGDIATKKKKIQDDL